MTAAATTRVDREVGDRDEVVDAGLVLAHFGFVTAFGHVSRRCADGAFLIAAPPLGSPRAGGPVRVELDAEQLPEGAPGETWMHLAIYRHRPDVQAVVRAQPARAGALSLLDPDRAPLHGQGALLGDRLPVLDDARLVRSAPLADALARALGSQNALLVRGNGALTVGLTPGQAVARMWILEAAAELAIAAGPAAKPLTRQESQSWQATGTEILDRMWAWMRDEATH